MNLKWSSFVHVLGSLGWKWTGDHLPEESGLLRSALQHRRKGNSSRWYVLRAYSVPVSALRSFKILTTLDDRDHYHPHFTEKHWDAGDGVNRPRRSAQFMTEQGCRPRPSGSPASLLTSLLCHSPKTVIWSQHICKCVCCVLYTFHNLWAPCTSSVI